MSVLNMTLKGVLGASLLCIVAGSTTASAQQDIIERLDSNGDAQLSKDEFLAGAKTRFEKTDVNRDNFLSVDERKDHRKAQRDAREDERFAKTDLNNDGLISKEEFEAIREKRREIAERRRDINGDGVFDKADKALWKDKRKARRAEAKSRRQEKRAHRKAKRIKIDSNDDGFISLEEHLSGAEQMFLRLDRNGDGVLSRSEGEKRRARKRRKKIGY